MNRGRTTAFVAVDICDDQKMALVPHLLEWYFKHHARFVARHPRLVLLLTVLIAVLCGGGWVRFETENNLLYLYAPTDSLWLRDRHAFGRFFNITDDDLRYVFFTEKNADQTNHGFNLLDRRNGMLKFVAIN